jgi:hypothetical protein
MEETISGKSGTITWEVDSATAAIIQTQYGGELKWGVWWIDCGNFTVDTINVYTNAYTGGDSGDTGDSGNTGTSGGGYTLTLGDSYTYSTMTEKMIGWSWADFGIGAGETIQKVQVNISTKNSSIGKWQGAFGSSTSVAPDYWTQGDDMEETISGKSGSITWEVDSATAAIIQTQYGGELKWGVWWIDCGNFTVDSVTVYTDKNGEGGTTPTTTTTTTTTTKTTTTTTKTTTTTTKTTTTTTKTTTTTSKTTTTTTTTKLTTTTAPIVKGKIGDINLDNKISLLDIITLNKSITGSVSLNPEQTANADCNGNGSVSADDLISLMKYIVQKVDSLPA